MFMYSLHIKLMYLKNVVSIYVLFKGMHKKAIVIFVMQIAGLA